MSHNVTEELTKFIEQVNFPSFTTDVIAAAKMSLLDFVGVAIAGYHESKLNQLLMNAVGQFNAKNDCTILGDYNKAPAIHAALINATSGHS